MATFEFSEAERHIIDDATRKITNGEMLTSDEALLYARFEAYKAISAEEFRAAQEREQERNRAEIEEGRKTAKLARDNLEALSKLAIDRYERTLDDGK